ncbi:MAG: hypothetical protein QM627_00495 [Luteolibacter sp.]
MKLAFRETHASEALCHYHIDVARRLRTETYQGRVGLEEMRSMAQCMVSDPLWSMEHHSLIDLRAADLELTANEILRLALLQRQDAHYSKGWRAYVATTSTTFGVVRMLTRWARTSERSLFFRTLAEAENWLNANAEGWGPEQEAVAPLRKIG